MLRIAALLTQLGCAACLLIGTIAFVVSQQDGEGGGLAIVWALAALTGLVCGGLMTRGALLWVIACVVLDLGFGITAIAAGHDAAAALLRLLSDADVALVGDVVVGVGVGLVVAGALCLAAIPQAIRYVRWLHAAESPASTVLGMAPAERPSLWRAPAQPEGSRRRMYFALGGFAIGLGAGTGVLISSMFEDDTGGDRRATREPAAPGAPDVAPDVAPDGGPAAGSGSAAGSGAAAAGSARAPEPPSADTLVEAQRAAIERGDVAALTATVWPDAVGFGVDAEEVVIGREALAAQLAHDLGDLDGAAATVHGVEVGGERGHAWIAYELAITTGSRTRELAITELAAWIGGRWQVVAWHWARPVPDRDAERAAVLGSKPVPQVVPAKLVGPKAVDTAVRAAFASRAAFVEAYSDRAEGFNFGSAPGERIVGGAAIRRVFGKLHAEIARRDGPYVVAGGAWDPAQQADPWIAVALLDADFTTRTRAGTPLTHTFRVLAVLLKDGAAWKLVQTQWSHGGPI